MQLLKLKKFKEKNNFAPWKFATRASQFRFFSVEIFASNFWKFKNSPSLLIIGEFKSNCLFRSNSGSKYFVKSIAMPRTKVNRNVQHGKRVRDNSAELEEILRDFEIEGKQANENFFI